ncbi:MAG: multiheme c-type cytochrome [Pirellulaceae bacterium]
MSSCVHIQGCYPKHELQHGMRIPGGMLVAALLGVFAFTGCRSDQPVMLLVSGDTAGWITPCGCASNQSGGLPRRGGLIVNSQREHAVVVVDAGGSAIGTGPYQRIKLLSLLNGLQTLGLQAHNIGGPETQFTPRELRELASESGTNWLSANLTADDGQPVGQKCLLVERSGLRIAITGIVDPQRVENPSWQAQDPIRSVLNALQSQAADVKVVLAYFDEGELRALAESLPEVDYLIGGPTGQAMSPTKIGPVTVMSATNKGKFLAGITLASEKSGFREIDASIVEVSSDISENDAQLKNLKSYYAKLKQQDFTAERAGLVQHMATDDTGYAIAGSESCAACHQTDDAVWHDSKHAHAWEVLVAKSAEFDPHCQQCHTTGYGYSGGFENVARSRELVHVGCENCHGPSQAHVSDPRKRTPFQAKEQCLRCHDHENSPAFQFDPYWTKVLHAGSKTPGQVQQ